ncbi:Phytosulfokine precursor protein (PSK) [Musa troglodytarum]|uniref:Phytosulfokine n=1 Tax=Musa troglodytarum TaxID=320322 RepID=A0A9E7E7M5_9LILI|nr:Phytosulfokine precursor protein (PSK) [Musa troglodytarum]
MPEPADPLRISDQQQVLQTMETMDEGCRGVGVEECLMRRTLAAHTDYIYTQGNKH